MGTGYGNESATCRGEGDSRSHATAADHELVEHARREGRTIITLDSDFHALLALSNADSPSVVRVRIQGLRGIELASLVEQTLALCIEDLRAGAMVTVDEHNVRVRLLPLVR